LPVVPIRRGCEALIGPANHRQNQPVPPPQEGRIAIVTDVGRGMRWTFAAQETNAPEADGEVVWA